MTSKPPTSSRRSSSHRSSGETLAASEAQPGAPGPGSLGAGLDSELGLEIVNMSPEGVVAELELSSTHHQPFGIVHGGVYCAVAESVASISAYTWLQSSGIGGTAVGVNNNTDFLRSVSSGTLTARATPVHRGRRQQLWNVDMVDDNDRLIAKSQVRLQNIELPDDTVQRS